MFDRPAIKRFARSQMQAQYGIALGTLLLLLLIASGLNSITCGIGTFVLYPPLLVGYYLVYLKIFRGQKAAIGDLFSGFNQFGRNLGGMLWMELWICLWSLLFFIPGIVKFYAYRLTPYILADSHKVSATEALKLSMVMTEGHKGKIFLFELSYIGWMLLSALTCGLLLYFYVAPWMETGFAGVYDELKQQAIARGLVDASLFD